MAEGSCLSRCEPCCNEPSTCTGNPFFTESSGILTPLTDANLPQIVLSHFSMPSGDLGPIESFPHRQMRTTSDVICSESVEFLHGGLHLQVTHHLFPRLPRHNLRRASELVKQFAKEEGLTYAEFGFVDGNGEVIGTLRNVAEQVKIIGKVASVEVKEAFDKKVADSEAKHRKMSRGLHSKYL